MRLKTLVIALALLVPTIASAQSVDPTTVQTTNNVVSYGTVSANVGMDLLNVLTSPDKSCTAKREAFKVGLAIGISEALKAVIHRQRPDGSDFKDFPSEHTAIAFASSGWSVSWGYSLAIGTGVERRTANKHDWTGILGGAAVGYGSKYLGDRFFHCQS